jgi:ribonuclease P protein component
MGGASSFAPRMRLHRGSEFRRVLEKGVRMPGPLFLLVATENSLGHDRLGLTVSRRVGGAVARNRARRLIRESFRRQRRALKNRPGLDVVVLAARALSERHQAEVDREFADRLRRVEGRIERRGRQAPLDPHRGL